MNVLTLAVAALTLGTAAHPTPKVVLVKHADFIRQTMAGATQYFVRTVTIGKQDLAAIRKSADFTPDDPDVQFFLGQNQGGKTVGVSLFQQVNTPHGPIEVGLTFGPDGAIASAVVTTATVETKPWVQEATGAGLMKRFVGLRQGDDTRKALTNGNGLNGMPEYMAELIATAVGRGLVLYGTLYKESSAA
ncbi:MAG TPA: hypothetical protein VH763_16970 [Gemmatimonadales bacterium]|jgi:hypothetical protein